MGLVLVMAERRYILQIEVKIQLRLLGSFIDSSTPYLSRKITKKIWDR